MNTSRPTAFDQHQFLCQAQALLANDPTLTHAREKARTHAKHHAAQEALPMQTWAHTGIKLLGKTLTYGGILMTASVLSCPPVILAGMGACALGSLVQTLREGVHPKKRWAM